MEREKEKVVDEKPKSPKSPKKTDVKLNLKKQVEEDEAPAYVAYELQTKKPEKKNPVSPKAVKAKSPPKDAKGLNS